MDLWFVEYDRDWGLRGSHRIVSFVTDNPDVESVKSTLEKNGIALHNYTKHALSIVKIELNKVRVVSAQYGC